jgi:hypothetical protein
VALGLFDIRKPFLVAADRVHADPDHFAIALVEFRLEARHVSQLGGAHRREILGMGEQDCPAVPDPFVEVDRTLGSVGGEIRGFIIDA